ncbi:MAG: Tim44 domain-containing protein [Burkholderiales bacterium]|jgi:predicted lipid-binding transport protein (Tim44 family)
MGSFIASRFKSLTQNLKHVALSFAMVLALATAGLFSADAEASKRLGSGGSSGKQSSIATQKQATPPQAAPSQAAAPAGAQAAAQSQRSKWLGPIAGLAAGLGLAALASHFGFGEELANFMMIALLVMAVLFIIRMVMARRQAANQASSASGQPAWAAAGAGSSSQPGYGQAQQQNSLFSQQNTAQQPAQAGGLFSSVNQAAATPAVSQPWGVPADFDVAGFVENAKHHFRRLQAANDAGNLDDLREFTSPQLFEEFAAEIRTRQGENYTEVVRLDAELLGIETQDGEYLASVRFSGLIREGRNMPPQTFDEVWNLSKPLQGAGGWVLSGIQQMGQSH